MNNDNERRSMRELVVLSGKGGTGKTTVTASLVALAYDEGICAVAVDCDVDASNLHLVLGPDIRQARDFIGGAIAVVDRDKCTECGLCQSKCLFDAIPEPGRVDPYGCEGCGVCALVCPASAVEMRPHVTGNLYSGRSPWGAMVWAGLKPGAGNSGKLTAEVREEARKLGAAEDATLILSDGPPGLGCPVISALTGADMALLVTEPSVSGQHDLDRVADLCKHFGVPAAVVVNKADLNPDKTGAIRAWCVDRDLPLIAEIPFDPQVPSSISRGRPLVTAAHQDHSPAAAALAELWGRLRQARPLGPTEPG